MQDGDLPPDVLARGVGLRIAAAVTERPTRPLEADVGDGRDGSAAPGVEAVPSM